MNTKPNTPEPQSNSISSENRTISKQDRLGLLKLSVKAAFIGGAVALREIENRIRTCLDSEASELTEISTYLLDLGGKRMRPLLTILVSQLFGMKTPNSKLIDAAAGIELIHMATLLHDDIIDQSPLRRSQPSAYSQFGLSSTLLSGDFLLVRAFGLCAKLDQFIVTETENACIALTEGEITEGIISKDTTASLDSYLIVSRKKTAALFSLASVVGGHLAGADPKEVELLRSFGNNSGIAFQMIDDILDITADEDLLGKPAGTDLKQRTPSLVNILWLEKEPELAREYFFSEPCEESVTQALSHLRNSSIIDEARAYATQYAGYARNDLMSLSEDRVSNEVREQLLSLLDYTLERCL